MDICPKCGVQVESDTIECSKCGVIFEKYLAMIEAKAKAKEQKRQEGKIKEGKEKQKREEKLVRQEEIKRQSAIELESEREKGERKVSLEKERRLNLFEEQISYRVIQATDADSKYGATAIIFLQIVAWLNLVGGFFLFLARIGENWALIWLVQGIVGCIFLNVVCSIAYNLIGIMKNTTILVGRLAAENIQQAEK